MKIKLIISLLLLFISTPALAQNQAGFCKLWFTHKVNSNVKSAAYTPGVDVNGNAVTSADVNANDVGAGADIISLPVTVDLAQSLAALNPAGLKMEATVGMMNIHRNGRVTMGDEDISDEAVELCTGEKPVHTPVATKPVEPKAPEVPLVKAPETTSTKVIKRDDPALLVPTEPINKDEIIWGQDY